MGCEANSPSESERRSRSVPSNNRNLRGDVAFQTCGELGDFLASVWLCQVKRRSDRHDSSRIDVSVRHVVMALDVIEIDRVANAGLLI